MRRAIKLGVLWLLATCIGCAFTYREATAPTDQQMWARYTAPAAGLGVALNAAKVPWWGRLGAYVPVWVQCRYGRALQIGEWCHRPESVGLNLGVGYFLAEFYYFIKRRGIR